VHFIRFITFVNGDFCILFLLLLLQNRLIHSFSFSFCCSGLTQFRLFSWSDCSSSFIFRNSFSSFSCSLFIRVHSFLGFDCYWSTCTFSTRNHVNYSCGLCGSLLSSEPSPIHHFNLNSSLLTRFFTWSFLWSLTVSSLHFFFNLLFTFPFRFFSILPPSHRLSSRKLILQQNVSSFSPISTFFF
jgi:hypothetical protein